MDVRHRQFQLGVPKRHHFILDITSHAVWRYYGFSLRHRITEEPSVEVHTLVGIGSAGGDPVVELIGENGQGHGTQRQYLVVVVALVEVGAQRGFR